MNSVYSMISLIKETLDQKVISNEVFTIFDITKEARTKTSATILHKTVKDIVVEEFLSAVVTGGPISNYNGVLCTLNLPNKPKAFVYYPKSKSVSDHPLVSNSTGLDTDDDNEVIIATAEGRINIPKKLLDKIDCVAGSYDIMASGTIYCCKPNLDGRVRISVNKLGLDGLITVTVNLNDNTIDVMAV